MTGLYINMKSYDFKDPSGKQIKGHNMNCLVDGDIVKVSLSDEERDYLVKNGASFGSEIPLDVRVKGKFAKYILAH